VLVRLQKDREALSHFVQLYQANPSDREAAVELIRTYSRLGLSGDALAAAQAMTERFPLDPDLLMELADVELGLGHAKRCSELYLKALEHSQNKEGVSLRYADRMNAWGDFYRAESIYRSYLEKHPQDTKVRLKLARCLMSSQRYDEAEGLYRLMLLDQSRNEEILLELARLKLEEKDFQAALSRVDAILRDNPPRSILLEGLSLKGEILYRMGLYAESFSTYEQLSRYPGARVAAWLGMGKACLKQDKKEEAKAWFAKAQDLSPDQVEARFYGAGVEKAFSRDFLRALLSSRKETPLTFVDWARIYASLGRNGVAIACYEEALKRDAACFPARMGLAEILAVDHRFDRAIDAFKELAREYPGDSKIWISLARALGWSKRYDESIKVYNEICRANPLDPVPRMEKARTAAWGKRMEEAEETYRALCEPPVDRQLLSALEPFRRGSYDPRLSELFDKIDGIDKRGSLYEGYETFSKGLSSLQPTLPPGQTRSLETVRLSLLPLYRIQKGAYLESRAKALAMNGRFTQAMDTYEELTAFRPGNEEAHFDYAQIQCALGLSDREADTYERLLTLDPLHGLAGMALERQQIRISPSVTGGYSYWKEEGRGELARIARQRADLSLDFPILSTYHLKVAGHRWVESPTRWDGNYQAYGYSVELNGVVNPYISGALNFTRKDYTSKGLKDEYLGFANLWFNLRDYARLGLGFDRRDELYNNFGVKQGIQADHWWAELISRITKRLEVRGMADIIYYTDDNRGQFYGLSIGYAFTDHPRVFKVMAAGEYRDTKHKDAYQYDGPNLVDITHPYWTPQNYYAGSVTFEWNHDLSKLFFCGCEANSYDIRLTLGTDTEINPAIRVEGGWHYEFLGHWVLNLKGLVHRSKLWNAEALWASLQYRF
jgi:tetratricopeptide (TPR) repeat protein